MQTIIYKLYTECADIYSDSTNNKMVCLLTQNDAYRYGRFHFYNSVFNLRTNPYYYSNVWIQERVHGKLYSQLPCYDSSTIESTIESLDPNSKVDSN